jgi:hypothetical protein
MVSSRAVGVSGRIGISELRFSIERCELVDGMWKETFRIECFIVSSWMSGMVGALCKKVVLGLNGLL